MKRSLALMVVFALTSLAFAGVFYDKNPPGLRWGGGALLSAAQRPVQVAGVRPWHAPRPAPPAPVWSWSAPLAAAVAIDREGVETEIALYEGQDVGDPLVVPSDAVAVRLFLDGLIQLEQVSAAGRSLRLVSLDTLEVVLAEPGEETVTVTLALGEGAAVARLDDAALARLVEETALGEAW